MSTVSGALQRACHRVLWEFVGELSNAEVQRFGNKSIHPDFVITSNLMLNWTMVAVVIITLGDETDNLVRKPGLL